MEEWKGRSSHDCQEGERDWRTCRCCVKFMSIWKVLKIWYSWKSMKTPWAEGYVKKFVQL